MLHTTHTHMCAAATLKWTLADCCSNALSRAHAQTHKQCNVYVSARTPSLSTTLRYTHTTTTPHPTPPPPRWWWLSSSLSRVYACANNNSNKFTNRKTWDESQHFVTQCHSSAYNTQFVLSRLQRISISNARVFRLSFPYTIFIPSQDRDAAEGVQALHVSAKRTRLTLKMERTSSAIRRTMPGRTPARPNLYERLEMYAYWCGPALEIGIIHASMASSLEAFSCNPTHGSFSALSCRAAECTGHVNQQCSFRTELDYYWNDSRSVG